MPRGLSQGVRFFAISRTGKECDREIFAIRGRKSNKSYMRNPDIQSILLGAALILYVHSLSAQTTIFGANLIVNGDAESGPGGDGTSRVTSFPGWTAAGAADIYAYGSASAKVKALSQNDIVPVNHGNNYFAGGAQPANSSLTQSSAIDLSSAASTIDAGTVTFTASAYLGGFGGDDDNATVAIVFTDSNGAALKSIALARISHSESMDRRRVRLKRISRR